jgi:hypothetical protein
MRFYGAHAARGVADNGIGPLNFGDASIPKMCDRIVLSPIHRAAVVTFL